MHTIEKTIHVGLWRDRLVVRAFKDSSAMHRYLNEGSNGVMWRESNRDLKQGTYVWAGGRWHNVKNVDASALAHM